MLNAYLKDFNIKLTNVKKNLFKINFLPMNVKYYSGLILILLSLFVKVWCILYTINPGLVQTRR